MSPGAFFIFREVIWLLMPLQLILPLPLLLILLQVKTMMMIISNDDDEDGGDGDAADDDDDDVDGSYDDDDDDDDDDDLGLVPRGAARAGAVDPPPTGPCGPRGGSRFRVRVAARGRAGGFRPPLPAPACPPTRPLPCPPPPVVTR